MLWFSHVSQAEDTFTVRDRETRGQKATPLSNTKTYDSSLPSDPSAGTQKKCWRNAHMSFSGIQDCVTHNCVFVYLVYKQARRSVWCLPAHWRLSVPLHFHWHENSSARHKGNLKNGCKDHLYFSLRETASISVSQGWNRQDCVCFMLFQFTAYIIISLQHYNSK